MWGRRVRYLEEMPRCKPTAAARKHRANTGPTRTLSRARVSRWQDAEVAKRWAAVGYLELERRFGRIQGCRNPLLSRT